STGALVKVGPRLTASVPLSVDPLEFAVTPPLGVMVVALDNAWQGNEGQAQLLRLEQKLPKRPHKQLHDEPGRGHRADEDGRGKEPGDEPGRGDGPGGGGGSR